MRSYGYGVLPLLHQFLKLFLSAVSHSLVFNMFQKFDLFSLIIRFLLFEVVEIIVIKAFNELFIIKIFIFVLIQ